MPKKGNNKYPRKKRFVKRAIKAGHQMQKHKNQVYTGASIHKQVFPKKMFLVLESQVNGFLPIGAGAGNFFDVKMNSCASPWNTTPVTNLFGYTTVLTQMTGSTSAITQNPMGFSKLIGTNAPYLQYLVHASQIRLEADPLATAVDDGEICVCPINPILFTASPLPVTYLDAINRPFSKGASMRSVDGKVSHVTSRLKMRDILGLSKTEFLVAAKAPISATESTGSYAGSATVDPLVLYAWRCFYRTGSNAITTGIIRFKILMKYYVEFYHYNEAINIT